MGNYIIRHTESGYLYKGANNQWQRTQNLNLAERFTHEKAMNVLNNCIGPSFRQRWEIVSEDALCTFTPDCPPSDDFPTEFDWAVVSQTQHQLFSDLARYSEDLKGRLREVDLEICDIQHYIEFFALDAAKGYKAYKMLKERLERRRFIKDEILKVNCFLSGSSSDFSSGKVDRQLKGMDTRKYTPRILNELFGLDAPGVPLQHVS